MPQNQSRVIGTTADKRLVTIVASYQNGATRWLVCVAGKTLSSAESYRDAIRLAARFTK